MNLKPNYLVVFGDGDACASFCKGDALSSYLKDPVNKWRPKTVINLSKPKRWTEPVIIEEAENELER